ncbi:MAG TPA: phage major capsid protein [Hyphomonadaceae bacterium]|nr:phage major capsid protein [Hyphomonadaceae bacterium]HPN04966.1 phage major capsid protein [Hyphomonadaceae bacterium]
MTIETKMNAPSGVNVDARALANEMMAAFEALKAANDARIEEIEKRGAPDPLLDAKLKKIEQSLDRQRSALERLALEQARPAMGDDPRKGDPEHKSAWSTYMRRGDDSGIARLDLKSVNVGTEAQGGYVAPPELDRLIEQRLMASSPMRQIASVRQTSATVFRKPVSLGTTSAWAAETGSRAETTAPQLDLLEFPAAELYAMPAATQTLLDDAYADVDEWLADEVEQSFSAQESTAFVTGDGSNKPKGFLSYDMIADASHAWDKIGFILSGGAGAFAASNPADKLIDLVYALKSQYRANARFVMNRRTVSAVRKLKDGDGNYLWRPGAAGESASLLGYAVTEIEDMPDIAANSFSIGFGDFRRGYLIVDRQGARVLRDPYSLKPYVLFYTTKRVGGGVQNFDAIKVMKFAAS